MQHASQPIFFVHGQEKPLEWFWKEGTLQLPSLPPLSLYVHLPWCLKKCPYCDFNSHAIASSDDLPIAQYGKALLSDLESALPLIWGRSIESIFFGGGTPSLFPPSFMDELLGQFRACLPLAADCEIILEANPGTFEAQRFAQYRRAGINRLSIGVQSFNDTHLTQLGRIHNAHQARSAIAEAGAHFDTWNLDLMYALPHQTLSELVQDLTIALEASPPHLSIYHLTIEPNTYFAKYPPSMVDDDIAYEMLDCIEERTCEQGWVRYEVSAFAKSGKTCRHNLNYWQFGDYLGIGAGAHSKLSFAHRIVRQTRWKDPQQYMMQGSKGSFVNHTEEIARSHVPFEFMLNALRLKNGFPTKLFFERTGLPFSDIEQQLNLAESRKLLRRTWKNITPTKQGFDFLNDLQMLFLPQDGYAAQIK